ncbi:DUF1450 domain-containing protein [Paenibacillus oryzisoli]|uniref:DUF1450 domain-containing protein n=1 Tax=Paenibacillus oryzisoli TaxID=1850517 RepID=UPI003D26DD6A
MKTIKYCCRNEKFGSKQIYKSIKHEFPKLKQKKKDCLGNCRHCRKECIAMVGKKRLICAESPDVLYAQLKQIIAESRAESAMA